VDDHAALYEISRIGVASMLYRMAADFVLVVHLGFVLFVALGGFVALYRPRWAFLQVPAVIWGVFVEYSGWTCPLTPLEVALRERGGEAGYAGGFVEHTVTSLLYPTTLSRAAQIVLGTLALGVNAGVYWKIWRRSGRGRPLHSTRATDIKTE
jgi:hypothetical protein